MKGLYDNHNHCQFSFDGGRTSVEKSAEAGAAVGLAGMCFTDHCDLYVPPMKAKFENFQKEEFNIKAQQDEIDRVQDIADRKGWDIRLFKGIEIGLYKSQREELRDVLKNNSFDQVIASIHYLDDTDPFWGEYYKDKGWKEAYGHYLETLYEEIKWAGEDIDIMGHYDYVARYAPYSKTGILYKDFPDILDSLLKYLVENGKALELNTKTYQAYNGRLISVDTDLLKRYKELGGELISLGSDSHDPQRVGWNFDKFERLLCSEGFKYIAHFEKRRAVMTTLPSYFANNTSRSSAL